MLAVDTNVVVRYLTRDDPKQAAQAGTLIDGHEVFVSQTVLLETEWVLRSTYGYSDEELAEALTAFAGLPQVAIENANAAVLALGWLAAGLDFADAMHLACAQSCDAFATFDKKLARAANRIQALPVRAPSQV